MRYYGTFESLSLITRRTTNYIADCHNSIKGQGCSSSSNGQPVEPVRISSDWIASHAFLIITIHLSPRCSIVDNS